RIVDGRLDAEWDQRLDGVTFERVDPVGLDPAFTPHPIAALNVAMTQDVLQIRIADGANVERPILIRHIGGGAAPSFSQIRVLVGAGAATTVIETIEGDGAFASSLSAIEAGEGARVDRVLLQETDATVVRHGYLAARLGRDALFSQTSLSTGGKLSRQETSIACAASGASVALASAALAGDDRHADFTSHIRFLKEACETRQIHKGVARDRGRLVFQGKFHVERPAQKTDAQMTANALLLSDMAEANHKPELEIYADDVECAHGSTAGALDDEALFYLRQRGLSEHVARALLIEAFVGAALDAAPSDAIADILRGRIRAWLEAS
ncbi:MAG: Fe-S cluster assembly protein SufD, partial [Pseudomonadota bacterium]